ncbi:Vacuolar protein sorting-associated protein ist1, partial [Tieghemiomyces parasiticus]
AKRTAGNDHLRREVGQLLAAGKEENARIRVERVIREDLTVEAFEIIELFCELLLARLGLLDQMKQCDPTLVEAIHSLLYATPRVEVQELAVVRDQFAMKFGKEFVLKGAENTDNTVNPRLLLKLSWEVPAPFLVDAYLQEIARSCRVDWKPAHEDSDCGSDETTTSTLATAVNPPPAVSKEIGPASPTAKPAAVGGSPPAPAASKPPSNNSFDELTRRFEALKNRK